MHLQVLIEASFTKVDILYKWKIPFYYSNNKLLFYFKATKKGYVDVGFYWNTELKSFNEYLSLWKKKISKITSVF